MSRETPCEASPCASASTSARAVVAAIVGFAPARSSARAASASRSASAIRGIARQAAASAAATGRRSAPTRERSIRAVTPAMCGVSTRLGQPARADSAGKRLALEHIERRAAETTRSKRRRQRRLVDDAAARRVDQDRVRLHRREPRGVDQMPRRRRERNVQRDDVRGREQLAECDASGAVLRPDRRRSLPAPDRTRRSACRARARDAPQPADVAEADDAERLARELAPVRQTPLAAIVRLRPLQWKRTRRGRAGSRPQSRIPPRRARWRPWRESRRCHARAHAATSMLSRPTPSRPTTRSFGAPARSARFTCVRLRTMSASASAHAARRSASRSTRSAS